MAQTEIDTARVAAPAQPARAHIGLPRPRSHALLPAAIFLLGLAFDLYRLGAPSLWMDESFSVALARQPLPVLYGAFISGSEPNMIFYHLLLHGWLALGALAGIPATEFFVRFPSAIFAALSALVVFQIGRHFLNDTAGFIGAAIYLLTGLVLTYAQQTRSYSLQLLLVAISWYALLTLLHRTGPARRWWAVFVAASVLAVYSHAFSLLLLLAQIAAFGLLLFLDTPLRGRVSRRLAGMVASLATIGVLTAPFLYASRHGAKNGWLPSPQLGPEVRRVLAAVSRSKLSLAFLALVVLLLVAALVVARLPIGRRAVARLRPSSPYSASAPTDKAALQVREALPILLALACWLLIPTVVSYFLSQGSIRLFSSRYLVTVVPAACLLIAAAVALIRWRPARLLIGAGLLCAVLVTVPGYYAHAQLEDWRTPTRWLEAHYQPGDGLVSYNNVQGVQFPISYYLWIDGSPARFTPDSPGYVDMSRYGSGDPFAGFGNAVHPDALAAYAAAHPRLFFIAGRFTDARDAAIAHTAQQWLDTHYRLLAQTTSDLVTIRLYDTTQPPLP